MAKLTAKQEMFVQEYLIDLNATQAAIRAGYSTKTAKEIGSRLLTNVNVRARVDEAIAERSRRLGVCQDRIVNELAKIAFVNPADVVNFDEATVKAAAAEYDTAAILSVKVKKSYSDTGETTEREVKLNDKVKALELLGKHHGMFKDNVNISGDLGVKIIDDIGGEDDAGG